MRTVEPSPWVFTMMRRNSSGVVRRERAFTVAFSICPGGAGSAPIWPAATCVFCAWMAVMTSLGMS